MSFKQYQVLTEAVLILIFFKLSVTSIFGQSLNNVPIYSNNGLVIYKTKASYNSAKIYDIQDDLAKLIQNEGTNSEDYKCYYNPLSLIKNYYSYEAGEIDYRPPGNSLQVKTINIETMKPAKITELFSEKSIVNALKNDKWFIEYTGEIKIDITKLNSLEELLKVVSYYYFNTSSFAVLNYDKKTGLATIHLIGYDYIGFDHAQYLQLELLVKPNDEKIKLFDLKSNFYLDRFDNGVYNSSM